MRQFGIKPGNFLMRPGFYLTGNSSQLTSFHKTLPLRWNYYFQIKKASPENSRPALPPSLFGLHYSGAVSIKADY